MLVYFVEYIYAHLKMFVLNYLTKMSTTTAVMHDYFSSGNTALQLRTLYLSNQLLYNTCYSIYYMLSCVFFANLNEKELGNSLFQKVTINIELIENVYCFTFTTFSWFSTSNAVNGMYLLSIILYSTFMKKKL